MRIYIILLISSCFLVGCDMTEDYNAQDPTHSMAKIPNGFYYYGNFDNHQQVNIDKFWIDQYEVTIKDYKKCIKDGKCSEPLDLNTKGCLYGISNEMLPINCVTPKQAKEYCEFVDKRLPTEQEWEFVAKGIVYSSFPWGNDFSKQYACYGVNTPCQVGLHIPTAMGMRFEEACKNWIELKPIYDLAGNVAEITNSEYDKELTNTACSQNCAVRGGSYAATNESDLHVTNRSKIGFNTASPGVGFRCAATYIAGQ